METQNEEQEKELRVIEERLSRIGTILLVLSGKGGVGKSTVAVNIAAELAREGKEVGLLDVDIHGPSVPGMLGLTGEQVITSDGAMQPVEFTPNLKVMSIGFFLHNRDEAVIWRGPMKYGVIQQFLGNVEWGDLDYLVVDSPPGTGDEPLSVAQMAGKRASAVIVTTPQRVSVDDVRRSIDFCRKLEMPIAGIVENMSGFVCPHCNETVDIFESGGGKKLAEETGVPFLGKIPLDPRVVRASDAGRPFVAANPDSAAARAFHAVIENLLSLNGRKSAMKIAIPLANGILCPHFGHCEQFAILDMDEQGAVIAKTEITPPPHEPGVLPAWLHTLGVQHVIAGGMGSRAQELFRENGISVSVGASSAAPEELAAAYVKGTLTGGDNLCDH